MKRPNRYASRYLLPLEIFAATILLSWGVCGALDTGVLAGLLDGAGLTQSWGVVLISVALLQFVMAGVEAAAGRRWSDRFLLYSVSARCVCAFVSVPVWLYVIDVAIHTPGASFVVVMLMQAPFGVVCQAFIFAGNLRTRCLLDPKIKTERLERRVHFDRQRLVR